MSRSALAKIVGISLLVLGAVTAIPFFLTLTPSAEKESPKLTVALESIPLDSFVEVEWQNQPVIIFRPGPKTLRGLLDLNDRAFPPVSNSASLPPAFVYTRISTAFGCGLIKTEAALFGSFWPGGWHAPCHYGAWDFSGRFISGVYGEKSLPNLSVPTHRYTNGGKNLELDRRA